MGDGRELRAVRRAPHHRSASRRRTCTGIRSRPTGPGGCTATRRSSGSSRPTTCANARPLSRNAITTSPRPSFRSAGDPLIARGRAPRHAPSSTAFRTLRRGARLHRPREHGSDPAPGDLARGALPHRGGPVDPAHQSHRALSGWATLGAPRARSIKPRLGRGEARRPRAHRSRADDRRLRTRDRRAVARPHIEFIQAADVEPATSPSGPFAGAALRVLSEDDESGAHTALVSIAADHAVDLSMAHASHRALRRLRGDLALGGAAASRRAATPTSCRPLPTRAWRAATDSPVLAMVEEEREGTGAPIEVIDPHERRLDDHGARGGPARAW